MEELQVAYRESSLFSFYEGSVRDKTRKGWFSWCCGKYMRDIPRKIWYLEEPGMLPQSQAVLSAVLNNDRKSEVRTLYTRCPCFSKKRSVVVARKEREFYMNVVIEWIKRWV